MTKTEGRTRIDGFPLNPRSQEKILSILGGKWPRCISEYNFTPDGFVLESGTNRKLIPIYVAGLKKISADATDTIITPLKERGYHILDPLEACKEYLDKPHTREREEEVVDTLCYDVLMPRSKGLIALLNGNDTDISAVAEIATMADTYGPVVGIVEKDETVDMALKRYMDETHFGSLFEGSRAKEEALFYMTRLRSEILNPSTMGEVRHRTSALRHAQNAVADKIPTILKFFDDKGHFPGTLIHDAITGAEQLNADDITLSQLQMTAYLRKTIESKEAFPEFTMRYILTSFLNGADGPIARKMNTTSKEGGIKDASVDRLSEVMIAQLIAQETGMSPELSHTLQVSFQLSTLTKAACEMMGVKTKEGGAGGMIRRRIALYFVLKNLIKLKQLENRDSSQREKIIKSIEKQTNHLIEDSFKKAKERIGLLPMIVDAPVNPESSGASEARKFAAIVLLNNRFGIDIITELNKLSGGTVDFPTLEMLVKENQYIKKSLANAEGFLTRALTIAGYA